MRSSLACDQMQLGPFHIDRQGQLSTEQPAHDARGSRESSLTRSLDAVCKEAKQPGPKAEAPRALRSKRASKHRQHCRGRYDVYRRFTTSFSQPPQKQHPI